MNPAIPAALAVILAATGTVANGADGDRPAALGASDFAHLRFLEGTWQGAAPDGTIFRDRYAFSSDTSLTSQRLADDPTSAPTDSSTVSLEDGRIVSRWGEFSWTASEVRDGFVAFEPVGETPGSFSWKRVTADRVDVEQRWTDADGRKQGYVIELTRLQ